MKMRWVLSLLLLSSAALAGENAFYQKGTLEEMTSVECGYDENGGKGLAGAVLGTDSEHKKTRQTLCPEYVLRTDRVLYRIRPREEKHPALLPIGETAEFRMKKDRMVLRVLEGDGKEREYNVVSMTQVAARKTDGDRASK
ncbi:MAG TPA: hypothetical protein VFA60_05885 [Terriglobales bacterium]|nr:hypothetical protein [Terriglobales bacterium]